MYAQDDDDSRYEKLRRDAPEIPERAPPFVLNVKSAYRVTGRGTVIAGVIEQGVLRDGDHLELIQPGSADTAPLRCRCRYASGIRMPGRDPALEPLVGIMIGPDIEPDAIRPGAKLRAAASPEPRYSEQRRRNRRT